ncbi:hypothetical protein F183_A31470 [Bryobacterales bacterium F-183]|nr:hypothetical protein F183_A31470 [Bryobacterales bacterium F-183]
MNPKIFAAFAGGVLFASGVAYFAAKSPSAPAPAPAPVAEAKVIEPEPAPVPPPPQVADNTREPEPEPAPRPQAFRRASPVAASRTPATPAPTPSAPVPQQQQTAVVTPPPTTPPEPSPSVFRAEVPPPPPPSTPAKVVEPPKPNTVTIPAGTTLTVRVQETLNSERNQTGDNFQAVLDAPLIVDGFVIAEKGARVEGRINEVDRAGKVKGVARMVLELNKLNTSDGQRVEIRTENFERKGESSKKGDAAKVGIGAAIGAAIGAIAGGGKGAAVGAGAGGAAGAGGVLLTRGKAAEIPVETRLTFRLADYVTLTERLNK